MKREPSSYDSLENNHPLCISPSSHSFEIETPVIHPSHSSIFFTSIMKHINQIGVFVSASPQSTKTMEPCPPKDTTVSNITWCNMSIWNIHHIQPSKIVNKHISIFIHIFIMIVFEIYFYFNYVVNIERKEFLDKIKSYIRKIDTRVSTIAIMIYTPDLETTETNLYQNYLTAIQTQERTKHKLIFLSCEIAGSVGCVILVLVIYAKYKRIQLKWKSILYENIAMFILLGLFEYIFFTHVILQYNPITDQELEYRIYTSVLQHYPHIFNQTIPNGNQNSPIIYTKLL